MKYPYLHFMLRFQSKHPKIRVLQLNYIQIAKEEYPKSSDAYKWAETKNCSIELNILHEY